MWARELASIDLRSLAHLYAQGRGMIWLDSSSNDLRFGRYSYLCIDPVESIPSTANLDDLRRILGSYATERINDGPPFQGGLVGFFDYEFAETDAHTISRHSAEGGDHCHFRLYDTIIAVDHHASRTWIISSGLQNGSYEPCKDAAEAHMRAIREDIEEMIQPDVPVLNLTWHNEIAKAAYVESVNDILEFIRAGDIYQANFAQTFTASDPDSSGPLQIYYAIRNSNPSPFSAYGIFGERAIACTSPERLISLSSEGEAEARPIKGTIERSDDLYEDGQLRERLLGSEKDRAENTMVVDLLRNDLSKVCRVCSVQVPELCTLESYAGLHQLTSSIQGKLKEGQNAFDLFSAVFPGGSVTGAPKSRAMEVIQQLEHSPRRAFCGSFGYFGFDGAADFNIMIRTIQFDGDQIRLDVGSGITSLSDPDEEYSETLLKARKIFDGTSSPE